MKKRLWKLRRRMVEPVQQGLSLRTVARWIGIRNDHESLARIIHEPFGFDRPYGGLQASPERNPAPAGRSRSPQGGLFTLRE